MAKGKPIGVRFDIDKLERIKKEQGLDTPQRVVNWLMDGYGITSPQQFAKMACELKYESIPVELIPPGLKGIDLAIWKAEQKTKP